MELEERVIGGVLGLALGDALGAPFVGRRAHEIPDPLPALELPSRGGPPGSTTGGTAVARLLIRSLVSSGGFDPADLVARLVAWYRSGPAEVDAMTARVLRRVAEGDDATAAARDVWRRRGPEVSAGNGSVRSSAPLGLAFANRRDELEELAPALTALTHADLRCATSALAVTVTVAALARSQAPEDAVREAIGAVADREGAEELEYLVEEAGRSRPIDGPDRGFCLFTAGIALQTALEEDGFEGTIRRVVRLGGDAAANGGVAGALVGARVGLGGLPDAWVERLRERDEILADARALVPLAAAG
jgi:ADP-ribosyl-[dinitrogen reductase] hydrolase